MNKIKWVQPPILVVKAHWSNQILKLEWLLVAFQMLKILKTPKVPTRLIWVWKTKIWLKPRSRTPTEKEKGLTVKTVSTKVIGEKLLTIALTALKKDAVTVAIERQVDVVIAATTLMITIEIMIVIIQEKKIASETLESDTIKVQDANAEDQVRDQTVVTVSIVVVTIGKSSNWS